MYYMQDVKYSPVRCVNKKQQVKVKKKQSRVYVDERVYTLIARCYRTTSNNNISAQYRGNTRLFTTRLR